MRRLLRGLKRRLHLPRKRPAILMYHRVAPVLHDPWDLAVHPEQFDWQVRYMREHRLPMSVDEMVERSKRNDLPDEAVALTFDDAYRDNLVHAKPSLERYRVPATVFVPTGYIGKGQPFWWDELTTMILACAHPFDRTQTCGADEVRLQWGMPEPADAHPAWRGWDPPVSTRQNSYVSLWRVMQRTTVDERLRVMEEMRKVLPVKDDPLSFPMTQTELASLVEGGVVSLGAHSVHHVSLSDVSLEEGRREIAASRQQCQSFTAAPVQGFAYPYGNMTPEICNEVENTGFTWACAADGGCLQRTDVEYFRLPRVPAANVAGRPFSKLLTA